MAIDYGDFYLLVLADDTVEDKTLLVQCQEAFKGKKKISLFNFIFHENKFFF